MARSGHYQIYINDVIMPVTPSETLTSINNQNETINLIDGSEYNIVKKAGLTTLELDLLLPVVNEDNGYIHNWRKQQYYLDLFEKLKSDEESNVFSLMIIRSDTIPSASDTYFEYATLEDYSIHESAGDYAPGDIVVSLLIKKFEPAKVPILQVEETDDGKGEVKEKPQDSNASDKPKNPADDKPAKTHTVVWGDTLWAIAKKYYGAGERYPEIAAKNKDLIKNPNFILPGWKIRL